MTTSITDHRPLGASLAHPSVDRDADATSRAIVIGAGIGGLVAAHILARHYRDVIVLERDQPPTFGAPRKGVPQGRHVHGLLARGCQALEAMMPGVVDALARHGANVGDAMGMIRWHHDRGYHATGLLGLPMVAASRPLIEGVVRQRVSAVPGIRIIDGVAVERLVWNEGQQCVSGVVVSLRDSGQSETIAANLVIDASGRGSCLPAWLTDLGFPAPEESTVDIGIRYASRLFQRRRLPANTNHVTVVTTTPAVPRGGLAVGIEGDRWLMTLTGRNGLQPPRELHGFTDYSRSLNADDLYRLVRTSEPLDEGTIYSFPRSMRRHYERLSRFPAGLLPIGDAICGFNPIYAQGMTVAILEAEELDSCLTAGHDDLARRFFAANSDLIDRVWKLITGGDLRYCQPATAFPKEVRQMHWYMDRLNDAAAHDVEVALAFMKVMHLLEPPSSLMDPRISARVLAGGHEHQDNSKVRPFAPEPTAAVSHAS